MSIYDRDWYRDWHRKREGYEERSDFRVSQGDFERRRRARDWGRFSWRVVSWGVGLFLIARVVVRIVGY